MTILKKLLYAFRYYLLLFASPTFAHDITPIIQKIMDSNVTLCKYRAQTDAVKVGNHTGMTLQDPEVEFNYLWGSPHDVGQRKDISITQHFDYATIFGLKRREARTKDELAETEYQQARIICHQEAIAVLIGIAAANEAITEHRSQIATAEQIADMLRKKMNAGEANKIELNKALLDLATHRTDAAEAEAVKEEYMGDVIFQQCLDGETREKLMSLSMRDVREYLATESFSTLWQIEEEKAERGMDVAEAELRTARSASLPELTAGYMAELTRDEKFRGVTIGLSLPLWSNRGNVAKAKSQINALKTERDEMIAKLTAQRNALHNSIKSLDGIIESIETALRNSSSEELLRKALNEGEISMLEYISDREAYYDLRLRLIEKKSERLKKDAELRMLR